MLEDFRNLSKKVLQIQNLGWIAAGHNNIQGVLLEQLLGKPIENFEIPDFQGIEIKTHITTSNSYTTLFHANPEGEEFFEINRLCKLYGYPDSILKECKVLQGDVTALKRQNIGIHYQYRLSVNYKKKRIILYIYDHSNKVIEQKSYWDFNVLEEKLYRKLKYLAYITVDRKTIDKQVYFRYTSISFYKLRNFKTFLKLIENGTIIITFTIGVFRTGKRKGQIHNHGTAFRIQEKDIEKLFIKIC